MKKRYNAFISILIFAMAGMIVRALFVIKQCLDLADSQTNISSNERVDFYSPPHQCDWGNGVSNRNNASKA